MSRSKQSSVEKFIIFLIDGVSASTFDRLLAENKLPTMSRFVREGSYHNNVVASFPSVTGPGHIPLFSGYNPSSLDFVGHNQFDRKRNRLENYLLFYRKFGERFGDRDTLYRSFTSSVSLGEPFSAGASRYRRNIFALADWANIRGPSNWYVLRQLEYEYARGRDLIVAWLHETDALAHVSANQEKVVKSIVALDKFVAKFERQIDDKTSLVFCSDHGMERTNGRPYSLKLELKRLGFPFRGNRLFLDGGGFGQMYFKKDGVYKEQLGESFLGSLPAKLVERGGIDLALYRRMDNGARQVLVRGRGGVSSIEKNLSGEYAYKLESGQDPLGLINKDNREFLSNGITRSGSLDLSGLTSYPDSIYQIYELLMAPSSGDLIVTSSPGSGFNLLTRFAVHGGLNREQAVTFFLFSKPVVGLVGSSLTTADLPSLILSNRA